eukprot:EG_transcript_37924
MLEAALDCLGSHFPSNAFSETASLLHRIPMCKTDDGFAWEYLAAAALALQCLNVHFGNTPRASQLLPPFPPAFTFHVFLPPHMKTIAEVIEDTSQRGEPWVKLVVPEFQAFPVFDAFLMTWDGTKHNRWGYQMKQNKGAATGDPCAVDRAVFLRGDPPNGQ